MFQKTITKDEVNELELNKYRGEIVLVDQEEDVDAAIAEILEDDLLGIDTEARPAFKRGQYNPLALIQIATANRVFLFRTNKIGFPQPLREVFNREDLLKIGIALLDDVRDLKRLGEVEPQSMFDLNVYCPSLGFEKIGARNLSAMILGFRISKSQQTSDWEAEKLSIQQMEYAATDAWICREIYGRLKAVYS